MQAQCRRHGWLPRGGYRASARRLDVWWGKGGTAWYDRARVGRGSLHSARPRAGSGGSEIERFEASGWEFGTGDRLQGEWRSGIRPLRWERDQWKLGSIDMAKDEERVQAEVDIFAPMKMKQE